MSGRSPAAATQRHFNPDHYLETPSGCVYTAERNAAAWKRALADLDQALAAADAGSTLYLVVGLQGAGKSSWIARQAAALGQRAYFFDAALPRALHRQPLLQLAARHGVAAVAVWLDTPLAVALERNQARADDQRVPEAALLSVHQQFEAPSLAEGFSALRRIAGAPNKACPVLVRGGPRLELLAFRHPLAGLQLVKGGIEPGEEPAQAALRELAEEAGIDDGRWREDLGTWDSGFAGQVWSFQLCQVNHALPASWTHHTADDGGHAFAFFWHPLDAPPGADWHPLFQGALAWLRARLQRAD